MLSSNKYGWYRETTCRADTHQSPVKFKHSLYNGFFSDSLQSYCLSGAEMFRKGYHLCFLWFVLFFAMLFMWFLFVLLILLLDELLRIHVSNRSVYSGLCLVLSGVCAEVTTQDNGAGLCAAYCVLPRVFPPPCVFFLVRVSVPDVSVSPCVLWLVRVIKVNL